MKSAARVIFDIELTPLWYIDGFKNFAPLSHPKNMHQSIANVKPKPIVAFQHVIFPRFAPATRIYLVIPRVLIGLMDCLCLL